jgi:hypothetical protein
MKQGITGTIDIDKTDIKNTGTGSKMLENVLGK